MIEMLRDTLVRPMALQWLQLSDQSWRSLPVPDGSPWVRVAGPDPDRLLLIGSGIAVGYGVTDHHLGLAGQLARQLSAKSGRGAEIEIIAADNMPTRTAISALDVPRLRSLDAVIVTPGSLESLLLLPMKAWRRELEKLLDHVDSVAPASLQIFIVGVPPLSKIVSVPWVLGRVACASIVRLNHELRRICHSRESTTYIPFVPTQRVGNSGTGKTYERWASLIAPIVASRLERCVNS